MTVPSLPPGCLLRSARPADKAAINKFMLHLQRETLPVDRRYQVLIGAAILSSLGISLALGGLSTLLALVGLGLVLVLLSGAALLFSLRDEKNDFWVVEYAGVPVACAKLCCFHTYSVLYDLYVLPNWRGQGIGSYIVRHLGQQANKPLYLGCLPTVIPFYTRLGFRIISPQKLPPLMRYELGVTNRFKIVPLCLGDGD